MKNYLLIALLLSCLGTNAQEACNLFWDTATGDTVVSDSTVPYPNTEHCDEHGLIRLVCNHVEVQAYETGYFYLVPNTRGGFELYMREGATRAFSIPNEAQWLELWYEYDIVGLVDIIPSDCSENGLTYPPDNRVNWQQGDSFFAAYVEENWLYVYATDSGEGVLILATQDPACSEDGLACLYLLSDGTYQLNLIDPEGKLYEVPIEFN